MLTQYTLAVRRFLIIFFVMLLPLQFSWGAAATYCAHETGSNVSHFGHHAHVHKVASGSVDSKAFSTGGCDPDCGYCHSGSPQPPQSSAVNLPVAAKSIATLPEALPLRFRVPDTIERPNWSLAV